MSLFEHIQELRRHMIRAVLWFVFCSAMCFLGMHPLIAFLKKPYEAFLKNAQQIGGPQNLTSLGVFEVMSVNFKVCFLVGFATSLPFLVLEIWKFVSPALYALEKKIAALAAFLSLVLFYLGISFCYFFIIPYFFQGALGFASQYAFVFVTYENYFHSLAVMLFIFAAIFEVPIVLSLLGLSGLLPSQSLAKNRKIVFLGCFIVGAILAPPDVMSLCFIAIPMYLMVEVSIHIIKHIEKKRIP